MGNQVQRIILSFAWLYGLVMSLIAIVCLSDGKI